MKRKIYECPRKCHIADHDGRCPRCGENLKYMGYDDPQKVYDETLQRQRYEIEKGTIPTKINNSWSRALQDKFKKEEAIYKYNLRKNG